MYSAVYFSTQQPRCIFFVCPSEIVITKQKQNNNNNNKYDANIILYGIRRRLGTWSGENDIWEGENSDLDQKGYGFLGQENIARVLPA